jgi:hypothetical protein
MWSIIGGIVMVAWLIGTIKEHLKKKNEKASSGEDGEFIGELPPIPKESMLDYDLMKVLSAEWLPSGMGPDHRPHAREYIRSMIVGEILLRVKREAINPEALEYQGTYGLEKARSTFEAEVAAHRKYLEERKIRLEALQSVMDEYGISKEWILANGEFKPKPYDRPFVPFANPIGSITSSLNMHQRNLEEYSRDSMLTYNNHDFGNPLPYSEFEKISDREIDLMIQFKDRLTARFLAPVEVQIPPPLSEAPHPDEKYRPKR